MYGYFVTSFRTVICNDVRINYDNELFENVNVHSPTLDAWEAEESARVT